MDERIPDTQPSGALVPPPRIPPTAVATAAPMPPRPPRPHRPSLRRNPLTGLRTLVDTVLDELDSVGDRVAAALGLRRP